MDKKKKKAIIIYSTIAILVFIVAGLFVPANTYSKMVCDGTPTEVSLDTGPVLQQSCEDFCEEQLAGDYGGFHESWTYLGIYSCKCYRCNE